MPPFHRPSFAYGVTTHESRRKDLFPRTLESLCRAGFDRPRLFVDHSRDLHGYADEFGLPVTVRGSDASGNGVRTAANWHLALMELYVREPNALRYAIFQDDMVTVLGLREYLEKCHWPKDAYLNLYTFPPPRQVEPTDHKNFKGWYLAKRRATDGGPTGQGAVALVFDHETVVRLLSSRQFVERHQCTVRGFKSIDGGITEALDAVGVMEYVHWPSLVQHTGDESSRAERKGFAPYPTAPSFPGEEWDARTLLD